MAVSNALDILRERGFVKQTTHDEPLRSLLANEKATVYVGIDPTADSLHVGHFVSLMALAHLARAGHRPVVLLGGGTAMIGDPSFKTEMRHIMSVQQIETHTHGISAQVKRLFSAITHNALVLNNADWLREQNYIDFLREVGAHFSVNRMLTAECYKGRLEKGLSFIEFNYMLLQAYDFLHLYRHYGCRLQMGGDDQWSNILAGADLIRRVEQVEAYGVTWPLVTTSSGSKMGKTEAGAVWLDPARTTPYDFYQYWRNSHDADVKKYLALFTFLPMGEVDRLGALEGRDLNAAKEVLAWEVTRLVHGEVAAAEAQQAARALFTGGESTEGVPTVVVEHALLVTGLSVVDLLVLCGILPSKGEVKRLIQGGGLYINEIRVDSPEQKVGLESVRRGVIVVRRGKKQYTHIRT
ncbi:MAG: Tyrosine--tRNA ligase [Firmicutes bacterium]|nr:Tyrosine--tRNA ligase [candidate division NPL-UPA2 bacterium]